MIFTPEIWPSKFLTAVPKKTGQKLLRNLAPADRLLNQRSVQSSGNTLLLASLATHLNVTGLTFGKLFPRKMNRLIKEHRLSSLLEIGPADGRFLQALDSLTAGSGLKLHALGPASKQLPGSVESVNGYVQDYSAYFGERKFDLIVSSGVFSDQGFSTQRHERFDSRSRSAINCFKTMINALSDHPLAACIAVAFHFEYLLPKHDELSPLGRIAFWYGLPNYATIVIMTKNI